MHLHIRVALPLALADSVHHRQNGASEAVYDVVDRPKDDAAIHITQLAVLVESHKKREERP
jgi:hypothetical protein